MIIALCFVLGFGYAMLRKQRRETLNMLRIIDRMTENDVDKEKFDRVLNAFENKYSS